MSSGTMGHPSDADSRPVTLHRCDASRHDALLDIAAIGPPGPGGECSTYVVDSTGDPAEASWAFVFQEGPLLPGESPNGVSTEAVLAILVDRLTSFQAGPYGCAENAHALHHCVEALQWLKRRTEDRAKRNVTHSRDGSVEGKLAP